jgi:hypothetical protein
VETIVFTHKYIHFITSGLNEKRSGYGYIPTINKIEFVIESVSTRYAFVAAVLILGLPIVAFLFYVHIGLGAFWFGLDYFFRYVMAPALEKAGSETATSVIPHLTPTIVVVGESLTVGTIGSGIGLSYRLGYWTTPSIYLWGALCVAAVMILIVFGPLHSLQTEMLVELSSSEPDKQRVVRLNNKALRWLMGMTGLMLIIIAMMTGLRGLLPSVAV